MIGYSAYPRSPKHEYGPRRWRGPYSLLADQSGLAQRVTTGAEPEAESGQDRPLVFITFGAEIDPSVPRHTSPFEEPFTGMSVPVPPVTAALNFSAVGLTVAVLE